MGWLERLLLSGSKGTRSGFYVVAPMHHFIIAQASSLDGALSQGLGIIAKFLYIIAVIVIAHGGWQVRSGNADMGKMSIVGGLLLGLSVLIAQALFSAGGMPTISVGQ
jgi:hypothetical protein